MQSRGRRRGLDHRARLMRRGRKIARRIATDAAGAQFRQHRIERLRLAHRLWASLRLMGDPGARRDQPVAVPGRAVIGVVARLPGSTLASALTRPLPALRST